MAKRGRQSNRPSGGGPGRGKGGRRGGGGGGGGGRGGGGGGGGHGRGGHGGGRGGGGGSGGGQRWQMQPQEDGFIHLSGRNDDRGVSYGQSHNKPRSDQNTGHTGFARRHTGPLASQAEQLQQYREAHLQRDGGGGSKQRTKQKNGGKAKNIAFQPAAKMTQTKKKQRRAENHIDGSDDGITDEDEWDDKDGSAGETDEEFLAQQFHWIAKDMDPDRNKPKPAPATLPSPEPRPIITSWGGALSYSAAPIISDTVTFLPRPDHSTAEDAIDLTGEPDVIDLTDDFETQQSMNNHNYIAGEDKVARAVVVTESTTRHQKTIVSNVSAENVPQQEPQPVEEMPESMLWFMDTEPDIIVEETQDAYITLPAEPEHGARAPKAQKRGKRGGKKLKERNRQEKVRAQHDGTILLDEAEDEQEDDEMLALQDYLQNTMDSENEDQYDSFIGAMSTLQSSFGHSKDIGGLNPDGSDAEEVASEEESQDERDEGFAAEYAKRKQHNIKRSYFLNGLDQLYGSSNQSMNGKRKRNHEDPQGRGLGAIMEINSSIESFVQDTSVSTMDLPKMPKALRRLVHVLVKQYHLRSKSQGSGLSKFPALVKSERTRLPVHPLNISRWLKQTEKDMGQPVVGLQSGGHGGRGGRGERGGRGGSGGGRGRGRGGGFAPERILPGSVVGGEASALNTSNIGHRMLAKMGWSPGVGLGAGGKGITQPIEAIVRAKRQGLGHQ